MTVSWYSDLENANFIKYSISVVFQLPETVITVIKLRLLTHRWQKLLVQQKWNAKCLILPAALNPVQGQENTLKPSPYTTLAMSS